MADTSVPPAGGELPRPSPAQAQHVGRRESQQDAFGFSNLADEAFAAHGGHLAVLADGMGGMRNGLWAASHGVTAFIEAYHAKTPDESIAQALHRSLESANRLVHDEAERLNAVDRMGSTLVAAVVRGLELHWVSAGDSRIYLCEGGHLMRLSTDHSYGEILRLRVHRGELSAGEALTHPLRHALTSYLGRPEAIPFGASTAPVQLRPGAWVLLCSDGLTQALDDDAIAAHLHGAAQDAAESLLQAALARGLSDQDNVTAVLLQVPPRGGSPAAGSVSRAVYTRTPGGARGVPPPDVDACGAGGPGDRAAAPASGAVASPGRSPSSPARGVEPAAVAQSPRPRWREPLVWAGAAAVAGALLLLWLARMSAPPPGAGQAPERISIDLMAPSPAAAASRASP